MKIVCGAECGEGRVNSRNGCRHRDWGTRAGTVELAISKLRQGSIRDWLLQHRRAEQALVAVGVSVDGGRDVLGLESASDEDDAGWLALSGP
jgi:transposase-like protein